MGRTLIGYLGGTRIDYQGFPAKGGVLSDDINLAIDSMRRAKIRQGNQSNARWKENDYIEVEYNNGEHRKLLMKDIWRRRL